MKTPFCSRLRAAQFLVAAFVLLASPAFARDRFRIPPPPPPDKVLRDIRGFIHRVGNGVKNAIRNGLERDDEETVRARRPAARPGVPPESQSFARSKEAVPYRYDDADTFDARTRADGIVPEDPTLPKLNIVPRGASKPVPSVQERAAQSEARRPFMTPQESGPVQPAPLPETSAAPKAPAPEDDAGIEFARRVPGKPGLVYPPGAKETPDSIVDVGDFTSGQIVRDPRSGKLFRVP